MLYLTDIFGVDYENPDLLKIQKSLTDLFLSKKGNDNILLTNDSELSLEVYKQTIILQEYGGFAYDGPGGPGELLRIRYKEGSLIYVLEEVIKLFDDYETDKLITLLNNLPKPE